MSIFMKLWRDDVGGILCTEIVMVGTILVCGVITGLSALRDAVITELDDIAAAVGTIDQGFAIQGATAHSSVTASARYTDLQDAGDTLVAASESRCLVILSVANSAALSGNEGGVR